MLIIFKPGFYLGIDSGATRTTVTITKESGLVVGVGEAGTANLHNVSLDTIFRNINEAIESARADVLAKHSDLKINDFEAACLGLSGMDTFADREKVKNYINNLSEGERTFGAKRLIVANNGLTGLMSGTENPSGICLIAGSGSNCYGISRVGKEATAGNWGYLLGDQGSAFAIGQAILRQVIKEYDGRLTQTVITHKVLDFLKLADASQIVDWAYRDKLPVREIASLSKLCDDHQLSDVVEIANIINHTAQELAVAYKAVVSKLEIRDDEEFPVVLVGGLFEMKNQFTNKVIRSILNITPQAVVGMKIRSASEGASRVAMLHNQLRMFPESLIVVVRPE
ncbi:MAG: ATPase, BadF/BadG/BcrA/BcrD type [candidate division CPR2 bacterium GW2011_GWC1_41_48]|uniref:ATPase, BadF/BadG/BcrA/BcrD type n=1 Tax=candidate division CPR2 bacterium GW2011_GWC1_41_48 TaxID=1618344 RepID=A0A0G0W6R2_UNCC2|nr:MAG: ATPase, BadF/BadG/BcrA/BcrD type [candidate division CPR2 bacterium GW2011_GWC2_39_35]KKR27235.1 MAG: ATPase, BadF/BadG/BcrA/BcrD type [candidate division CPR2 bacterium GW2011_GWD2_39_7]KKR27316.1 MAG: ATPase, BadF/BadG/BcrA/BcrD type [candidate division CPR2 bacterium GW2011_GWD1_39_7]KKS08640.1 MAG: ATPase, BadF/BadG/BcrA/BcrD type [candidate division CPR2 bacterium GW2011_GWC1_41_48]OGB58056.1 MAG: hypothetical protein A2Y27_02435 [candidate division CPR2 bacterium GWD1_39_7]OGB726